MHQITKKYLFLRYWKSLLWAGIIAYGLLTSGVMLPKQNLLHFAHGDKILHLLIFFGLEWLMLFDSSVQTLTLPRFRSRLLITGIAICYAALTEVLQLYFTTKRDGDIFDLFADLVGILIALFVYNYTYSIINRFSRPKQ